MKLIIRNLDRSQFELEVEPTDNIEQVKKKIEEKHGHAVALQKLVYKGKILEEGTIGSLDVKPEDFFVLMVTKKVTPFIRTCRTTTSLRFSACSQASRCSGSCSRSGRCSRSCCRNSIQLTSGSCCDDNNSADYGNAYACRRYACARIASPACGAAGC
jgi:hypothetical protein